MQVASDVLHASRLGRPSQNPDRPCSVQAKGPGLKGRLSPGGYGSSSSSSSSNDDDDDGDDDDGD